MSQSYDYNIRWLDEFIAKLKADREVLLVAVKAQLESCSNCHCAACEIAKKAIELVEGAR